MGSGSIFGVYLSFIIFHEYTHTHCLLSEQMPPGVCLRECEIYDKPNTLPLKLSAVKRWARQ